MATRLYRWLLRLFPRSYLDEHGEDTAATFRELRDGSVGWKRLGIVARSFARLPLAAFAEWVGEWRGAHNTPARQPRSGRMERWVRQVRYALRTLWKTPSFTWSAVLLVGLGVGSVTTIFTLVDHLVLRALPYPEAERLVSPEEGSHSGPLFRAMSELPGFEQWAGGYSRDANLTGEGDPLQLRSAEVTEHFFELLGGRAVRGRLLAAADGPAREAVVVSEDSWRRIWGADPELVGRTINVDGSPLTVVGILDGAFETPEPIVGSGIDLWRPVDWTNETLTSHEFWILEAVGRLQAGVDLASAQSAMDGLMQRMADVSENYRDRDGTTWRRLPVVFLGERTAGQFRGGLGLLLGAVGLLLLVACANVAHLFLARGLGRHREMAVRRAMGADTRSLVHQLLVESLAVGLLGGAVGVGLASLGLRGFLAFSPYALPRALDPTLDLRVLGFAAVLSILTALAFGLIPAVRSVRGDPSDALKGAGRTATLGRGANMFRNSLLIAEVAMSLVLIASAGLLLRSLVTVRSQAPGFSLENVWTLPLTPPEPESPEAYVLAMEDVLRSLEEQPGVESVAYGLTMPLEMTGGGRCCWRTSISTEDASAELTPWMHPVSADYFSTLSIPVTEGRAWSEAETSVDPIPAVASLTFAVEAFGDAASALNRTLVGSNDQRYVITGISPEVRHYGLDAEHGAALYVPVERVPFGIRRAHVAVRVSPGLTSDAPRVLRAAVWRAAPALPIPTVRAMSDWMQRGNAERRFDAVLFSTFGAVALLLAAGGLYGTLLYVTGQRQREMAIRLALGATSGAVARWVLRGGILLAAGGVALGLAGSWVVTRFLESRLFGVDRGDPLALLSAALLLLVTAAVASWLPARRAGRTDPVEMLKAE